MSTDLATQETAVDDLVTCKATDAPDYGRLSAYDLVQVCQLHAQGKTQTQIAAYIGCSQQAVSYALRRMRADQESVQAAMRAVAPDMVDLWVQKAKKSPDFRAAKEFVETAHPGLRPQPAHSGVGGGVTINIGMPGQPIGLPTIDITPSTPEAARLSPPVSLCKSPVSDDGSGT